MSAFGDLRREWKAYFSHRLWIAGALLLLLCALAIVQYRWIGQVSEAQRLRAKQNLADSLAALERDFDIEITRSFLTFQSPVVGSADLAEQYRSWQQQAPYPRLIRGVYIANMEQTNSHPKSVVPDEPAIGSLDWQNRLPELGPAFAGAEVAGRSAGPVTQFQTLSEGGATVAVSAPDSRIMIDGNPAFVFPIMPTGMGPSAPVLATPASAPLPPLGGETVRVSGFVSPSKWAVIVLDAQYIRNTFLPELLKLHFLDGPTSDYQVLVVNKTGTAEPRLVFSSQSAPAEQEFARPDGHISLFRVRPDCFSSTRNAARGISTAPDGAVLAVDNLAEVLSRRSVSCPPLTSLAGDDPGARWEVLAKSRAGSLDQAMEAFRERNLLLGGSVLLVLALGIAMLVVATERARALAELQTEFVLGVSHELRTPLTVLRVAADNLKKGLVEDSEHARRYGEIMDARLRELSGMVEQALAFARLPSAAPIERRSVVRPDQLVRAAVGDSEDLLREAGMKVEIESEPDPPCVRVDAGLMKMCLANLIQNAAKYGAAGGSLTIRTKPAKAHGKQAVQISVEDRGPGISDTDLPHIFEPFYRGGNSASGIAGVGLGLTLVKRVVEAHDGTIRVDSSAGIGVRFSICLPSSGGAADPES